MDITFLGTGAAQGVPPVFSRNKFLDYVRKTKGKELRSKASLRLGKYSQIDIGPDNNWQNIRLDLDMWDVKNVFITHSHSDHFSYFDLYEIYSMAYVIPEDCSTNPISLYLSSSAKEWLYNKLLPAAAANPIKDRIIPIPLEYYRTYKCDDFTFSTVKGRHGGYGENESSINYLFNYSSGDSIYYALDTGYYEDETFEYLQDKATKVMITECTFGDNYHNGFVGDGHLNLKTLNLQIERLADIGFINEDTPIYITHISPTVEHKHEEFQKILDQFDFNYILSYDGLTFKFGNQEK